MKPVNQISGSRHRARKRGSHTVKAYRMPTRTAAIRRAKPKVAITPSVARFTGGNNGR